MEKQSKETAQEVNNTAIQPTKDGKAKQETVQRATNPTPPVEKQSKKRLDSTRQANTPVEKQSKKRFGRSPENNTGTEETLIRKSLLTRGTEALPFKTSTVS
ncbi:hypothetical protein BJ508DRAFT_381165 [Ascobolus immersus RN42]|uniref:Uncharacterized protein n=1 Tax=Ascobolus immersus RN42 TaxID=1160509 RepID=A0A3N4HGM7_ASCIM|nr:hypothetical protein BJ508DRAFT_381165 [Ascobolus immersus RN42]